MQKSVFREHLEDAIQKKHSKTHPWSEAWVSGQLDRRLLAEWTRQHYHYVSYFPQWLATVFANCDKDDVRHFLAENIFEEEGFAADSPEFPAIKHTELLLQFAEHCGMSRQQVIDAQKNGELLAGTLGLQSWCYRQSHRPFLEAMAGLLVGLESQVPQIYCQDHAAADRAIRFYRRRGDVLPPAHRGRPGTRRDRLQAAGAIRRHTGETGKLPALRARGDGDAPTVPGQSVRQVPAQPDAIEAGSSPSPFWGRAGVGRALLGAVGRFAPPPGPLPQGEGESLRR